MKIRFTFTALFVCFLAYIGANVQTGVTVAGDVDIISGSQAAVLAGLLTLEANLPRDGEVIMAVKDRQQTNEKGRSINPLKVNNTAGADVIPDLMLTTALTIPLWELRLVNARLAVPNDGLINLHDYSKIRSIGKGVLIIKSHKQPITQTGTTLVSFHKLATVHCSVIISTG